VLVAADHIQHAGGGAFSDQWQSTIVGSNGPVSLCYMSARSELFVVHDGGVEEAAPVLSVRTRHGKSCAIPQKGAVRARCRVIG